MASEEEHAIKKLEFLISKFPKRYNTKNTQYLLGILKAVADGDGYIENQVEAIRDNLQVIEAKGKYLDRIGSLYGVVRGQGSGVLDADFRKLIPLLGKSPKQITSIFQKIIDTIYGPFATHANVTSSAAAPFDISDGGTLRVLVDGVDTLITFTSSDAVNLSATTADELATAISKFTNGKIIGSVLTDQRTGDEFINIRTSTVGSQGFIQVLGGDTQTALRFPEVRPTRQNISTWNISRYQGSDEMLFELQSGDGLALISAGARKGDQMTIRLDSGFNLANTGTFELTFVEEDNFRIKNASGIEETGVANTNIDDFTVFRSNIANILLAARPATVIETASKELTVLLPVTSPIVKRTLRGGHHFHSAVATVLETTSTTADISAAEEMPDSGAIKVIRSRPFNRGFVSNIDPGQITMVNADGFPSKGALYSPTERTFYYYSGRSGNILTGVDPQPPADLAGTPVAYTEKYRYDSIIGNQLQNVFPDPTGLKGLEIGQAEAEIVPDYPGSFLYDLEATFIAGAPIVTTKEDLKQGDTKTVVQIDGDLTDFPETGSFIVEFNTKNQEGPIKYLGKIGNSALILDPSHVFTKDHFVGTGMRFVRTIGPHIPSKDGNDLAVYTTSTAPARDLLADYLRSIVAAGVTLKFIIQVPDQKWPVLPNLYSTDPLATDLT